jgi:hypothetical protein
MAIYALRRDDRRAVDDLTKLIQRDPTLTAASYTLGQTMIRIIVAEKRPEALPSALYQIARALAYEGSKGVPENQRAAILDYLTKAYTNFHGSADGLDQLLAMARTSPFPPSDFHIKSTVDIAAREGLR